MSLNSTTVFILCLLSATTLGTVRRTGQSGADSKKTVITEVDSDQLTELIDDHDHVAVLFYNGLSVKNEKVIKHVEGVHLDLQGKHELVFVKMDDPKEAKAYGLGISSVIMIIICQFNAEDKLS